MGANRAGGIFYSRRARGSAFPRVAGKAAGCSNDPRRPGAFLTVVTAWAQTELAEFFILAGLVVLLFHAWPGKRQGVLMILAALALGLAVGLMEKWLGHAGAADGSTGVLTPILFFFTKARAVGFGSRLAILSFLQPGRG